MTVVEGLTFSLFYFYHYIICLLEKLPIQPLQHPRVHLGIEKEAL